MVGLFTSISNSINHSHYCNCMHFVQKPHLCIPDIGRACCLPIAIVLDPLHGWTGYSWHYFYWKLHLKCQPDLLWAHSLFWKWTGFTLLPHSASLPHRTWRIVGLSRSLWNLLIFRLSPLTFKNYKINLFVPLSILWFLDLTGGNKAPPKEE